MKSKRSSLTDNNPLDEMFRSSAPKKSAKTTTIADVDPEQSEPELRQTTFILYEDQLDWLDEVCFNARRKGGKRMNKTAVIRGLVAFAREQGLNLEGVRNEDEMYQRITQLFSA